MEDLARRGRVQASELNVEGETAGAEEKRRSGVRSCGPGAPAAETKRAGRAEAPELPRRAIVAPRLAEERDGEEEQREQNDREA